MKIKWIVTLLCLTWAMSSCVQADKVNFRGVESVVPRNIGLTGMGLDVGVDVENASAHNLVLVALDVTLSRGDTPVLEMKLREKTRVMRHSDGVTVFPFRVAFRQGLGTLRFLQELQRSGFSDALLSGEVTVRAGWGRRKLVIPPTDPLVFARRYGVDIANLLDL